MTNMVAARVGTPIDNRQYSGALEVIRSLQPVEPAYLFCAATLEHRATRFLRGFPGRVGYAVKANPEPRVLETLARLGLRHFDVASLDEIRLVRALCPGARLHFNNPVKAEEAIREAYHRHGVRSFALDEAAELDKIRRATDGATDLFYSVRFKLAHGRASYDFGSKFGASPETAVELLRSIAAQGARAALTFHPGSQCKDPGEYAHYLAAAARIVKASGVDIAFINVGGGFPECYENAAVPALEAYFEAIAAAAASHFETRPVLLCEPGRAMVAPAASLLARVIHVRDDGTTLFVNDGIYGGMLELSVIDLRLPVRAWRDERVLTGDVASYRVFGPTCDPIDRLPHEITLPRGVRAGDYVEFGLLGAYGSATSTRFNGFQSAAYFNVAEGFPTLGAG
ncbi:MAG: hypothetical protein KDI05_15850 [Halieaceae bacterium]|nr:hypothetical protein [Halieaceae bacterium]MCP5205203.1 type III PLP-dependent enzyme [Pseudomonadales bacterium]